MRNKMDVEIPVLAGYLNVPTQSGFSLNRISKKKSCHRYCLLFKSSRHGIERLEICESKEDKNPKIITLENCVKITQEPSPSNLIHIVKKTGTLTLNTLADEDLKDWVNALQTVAFRDKTGNVGSHLAIEEDNDLYCSSFGDGLFIVTLIPSNTSIRCNIEPKVYMLNLTSTELQLKPSEDLSLLIATWPYRFIRKYGYRDGKFTFEAGRKCSTGEGVFTLDHKNPQEIFRCMSAKMKSMKKLISGDNISSNECGENHLNIAASMEAGSRSPLPPSPSNQHVAEFEINSTPSCTSLRQFISSNDSLNSFSVNSNTNNNFISASSGSVKLVPNKPPRKLPQLFEKSSQSQASLSSGHSNSLSALEFKSSNQFNCDKFKSFQSYEPVSITTTIDPNKTIGSAVMLKSSSPEALRQTNTPPDLPVRKESAKTTAERDYESIETITEAWKTLGVTDIKHTERSASVSNDEEFIDFVRQRSILQRDKTSLKEPIPPVKTPKIIDIDIGEGGTCLSSIAIDATYDRLDFLCPNNKTSSGYKTIVTVSSSINRIRCSPPPANDYELIASPDIQPCRKADDSYLGYGVLRKTSSSLAKGSGMLNASSDNVNATVAEVAISIPSRTTSKTIETNLDHRNYNELNYSIVSKPKKV